MRKLKYPKTLRIDRKRWLVGATATPDWQASALLLGRRMCCLGFYARACGMQAADLDHWANLSDLGEDFPRLARPASNTRLAKRLMAANDNPWLSFREREKRIAAGFAKLGVTVIFYNDYPEWVKERLNGHT